MKKNIEQLCNIGPVFIQEVPDMIKGFKKEGWRDKYVLFAGTAQVQQKIALPGQNGNVQVLPIYTMIFAKDFPEGVEPTLPKFITDRMKQQGPINGGNNG